MARTPLGDLFDRLFALARASERTGIPADELSDMWDERRRREIRMDRREFLRKSGRLGLAAAAGTTAMGALPACTPKGSSTKASSPAASGTRSDPAKPRIAIVGAGLAGTTAAFRLMQAGYPATIYEASNRVGGRTWTLRDYFDEGETVELCGEFINTNHHAIRSLASELDLTLDNLWTSYPAGVDGLLYINGGNYTHQQFIADFQKVIPKIVADRKAAGYPTTYDKSTPAGRKLDNMSLAEWGDKNIPGGLKSNFGQVLTSGYAGEYGLDVEDQSSLNLMFEAGWSTVNNPMLYGNQDWKYRVHGGNDLIANTIVNDHLPPGTLNLETPLVAVRANSDGSTTLTFQPDGTSAHDVTADIVVMACPFTALRTVDLDASGWSPLKRTTIDKLGMGTNSKLQMQFTSQVWHNHDLSGDTVTNLPIQSTDVVYPSTGKAGLLDNYTGGTQGASYGVTDSHAPAPEAITKAALAQIEKMIPGIGKAWNGKSYLTSMVADRWTLGSYSCPRPGEYSTIFGAAKLPEGNVLFAGEHTSIPFFGFMNGGVETGERAANEAQAIIAG